MSPYAESIQNTVGGSADDAAAVEYLMRTCDPGAGTLDALSSRAFNGAARRCYAMLNTPFENARDEKMRVMLVADARAQSVLR